MEHAIENMRQRLAGTTIDPRSLLSTDYFNHFNESIMLLGMLADMPEMLDEVDCWQFRSYCEHFEHSGLAIAPLAIEAYQLVPRDTRERFEKIAVQMSMLIVEARIRLRHALEDGDMDRFRTLAEFHSLQLQGMVDDGGSVVHGYEQSADQQAVDELF